jgi:hypothetical protein
MALSVRDELCYLIRSEYARAQLAESRAERGNPSMKAQLEQQLCMLMTAMNHTSFRSFTPEQRVTLSLVTAIVTMRTFSIPRDRNAVHEWFGPHMKEYRQLPNQIIFWTAMHIVLDACPTVEPFSSFFHVDMRPTDYAEKYAEPGCLFRSEFACYSQYEWSTKSKIDVTEIKQRLEVLDRETNLTTSYGDMLQIQKHRYAYEDRLYKSHSTIDRYLSSALYFAPIVTSDMLRHYFMKNSPSCLAPLAWVAYYASILGALYSIVQSLWRWGEYLQPAWWIVLVGALVNIFLAVMENHRRRRRNREFQRLHAEERQRKQLVMSRFNGVSLSQGCDQVFYDSCMTYIRKAKALRRWQNAILLVAFLSNIVSCAALLLTKSSQLNVQTDTNIRTLALAGYYALMVLYKGSGVGMLLIRYLINGRLEIRTDQQIIQEEENRFIAPEAHPLEESPAIVGHNRAIVAIKGCTVLHIMFGLQQPEVHYYFDESYFMEQLERGIIHAIKAKHRVLINFKASQESIQAFLFEGADPPPTFTYDVNEVETRAAASNQGSQVPRGSSAAVGDHYVEMTD